MIYEVTSHIGKACLDHAFRPLFFQNKINKTWQRSIQHDKGSWSPMYFTIDRCCWSFEEFLETHTDEIDSFI